MEIYDKLNNPLALSVFVLTLLLPILVGFLTVRKTKNQADFFVGGRAMGKVVIALSAVSSGRSSWLVLALSGMAFTMGVGAVWACAGYIIVEMFQFVYIGKKLRADAGRFQSITLFDYFESRYDDRSHMIRITGVVIIAVFMTAYVAAQLNAGAKALDTAFDFQALLHPYLERVLSPDILDVVSGADIGFLTALVISVILILVYMILGGYIAVAYNDVVRAVIMLAGLVVLPVYGLIKVGGIDALFAALGQLSPRNVDLFSIGAGAMIGFLGIGLGSPGQPHIVIRYMSIDDPRNLRYAAIVGTLWNIVLACGAVMVGLVGRVIFTNVDSLPNSDPETVYLALSSSLFGPALFGLLVGGVFAAILSTADSQLLVVASAFARDLYEKTFKESFVIDERTKLRLSRLVLFVSGGVAMVLAFTARDLIFWLVLFAWGGLGASFGPTLLCSLYWRGSSRQGVVAGMITGTLVTILWKMYLKTPTGIYELIPAFLCSAAAVVIVSLMTDDHVSA